MPDAPCPPLTLNGPWFGLGGGSVPVDPYPTADGTYYPAVVVTDGEPTNVVWVTVGGGESLLSRAARWVGRRFGY